MRSIERGRKSLGIDIGTNSLAWAILDDDTCDILDAGVLTFDQGMDFSAKSTDTPAAQRRVFRMARRRIFRKRLRKYALLKILSEAGMCPLSKEEVSDWPNNAHFPMENAEFRNWLRSTAEENPYHYRAMAASEKVAPFILGRALYHMCLHRGFKSSRKDATAATDEAKELGKVKGGIKELSGLMAEAGCATLGKYFSKSLSENMTNRMENTRIRRRPIGRAEHTEKEFSAIMDAQGYSEDDQLRKKIHHAIFFQRPLKEQSHLVGYCPLEPKERRTPISNPLFEEFRVREFVNNLSFEYDVEIEGRTTVVSRDLTTGDRELICGILMGESNPYKKFDIIMKRFAKDSRFRKEGYRFHYYDKGSSVPTCPTRATIKKAFGDIEYDEKKVYDALLYFDDDVRLEGWFAKHYPALVADAVKSLVSFHLPKGYAKYSTKAINKILPFLRRGYQLDRARFLAKLPDVMGATYSENEDFVLLSIEEADREYRKAMSEYRTLPYKEQRRTDRPLLNDYLRNKLLERWNVLDDGWRKLYLTNAESYQPQTYYIDGGHKVTLESPRLPRVELGMIHNPLVQRSLTVVRRLVNYLAEHGKINASTTIRIELARDVNDWASRQAWMVWQTTRAKLRERAAALLKKYNIADTEYNMDLAVLYQEQLEEFGGISFYSGRTINESHLFSGEYDVEHTVPRCLSGDDSYANKTLCEADYNRGTKKGMLPRECPNWGEISDRIELLRKKVAELANEYKKNKEKVKRASDAQGHAECRKKALVSQLELSYWRDKLLRFEITRDQLESGDEERLSGFKNHQLVDTGIISTHTKKLLNTVYPKVTTVNGVATAFARKAWGLQSLERKDRTTHLHHVIDAIVIAALTKRRFDSICRAIKDNGCAHVRECDVCPRPSEDFVEKVRRTTAGILVKHLANNKTTRQSSKRHDLPKTHSSVIGRGDTVRGKLHDANLLGRIVLPGQEGREVYVKRQPLLGKASDLEGVVKKIVDSTVRETVRCQLQAFIQEQGAEAVVPAGYFHTTSGVPIYTVRAIDNSAELSVLRRETVFSKQGFRDVSHYVFHGDNFRLAVFSEKPYLRFDGILEWAQNHKKSDYVPYDKQPGFMGYIMKGTMVLIKGEKEGLAMKDMSREELQKRLYRVRNFNKKELILSLNTCALEKEQYKKYAISQSENGVKLSKKGECSYNADNPPWYLNISSFKKFLPQILVEGMHFRMQLDGSIVFLDC